jgi:hypothetical protein
MPCFRLRLGPPECADSSASTYVDLLINLKSPVLDITPCSLLKVNNILEEHVASSACHMVYVGFLLY